MNQDTKDKIRQVEKKTLSWLWAAVKEAAKAYIASKISKK